MRSTLRYAGLVLLLALTAPARAQDDASPVPADVTFVISGGYWEEPVEEQATGAQPELVRGYYKLISVRQPDGTSAVHLQQIVSADDGPRVVSSTELDEFSALRGYVTSIRPENSTGISRQPGLFATVYLKTDPAAVDPESWTVLIDELGDIRIEKATN